MYGNPSFSGVFYFIACHFLVLHFYGTYVDYSNSQYVN